MHLTIVVFEVRRARVCGARLPAQPVGMYHKKKNLDYCSNFHADPIWQVKRGKRVLPSSNAFKQCSTSALVLKSEVRKAAADSIQQEAQQDSGTFSDTSLHLVHAQHTPPCRRYTRQ